MAHVRLDIEKLGERWSETLLWYARGVAELKKRPIADPTSWRYLAAIHGFDKDLWIDAGYLTEDEALPSEKEQSVYWGQCQHSTWFFLPWHRGYTAAVEQILRSAIVGLGGPKEWAFPYWNYNESSQSLKVPACFSARTLPDGTPNPLFVERRFGTELNPADIALKALTDPVFEGRYDGVPPGFGGSELKTAHDHPGAGGLEKQPHNVVHNIVGGSEGVDPKIDGLMGDSDTAALDPIFWAHHANIDRLWEVWRKRNPDHQNPDLPSWYNGPVIPGLVFIMPTVEGTPWTFKAGDMVDTLAPRLDYIYEDTSDPISTVEPVRQRLLRLGIAAKGLSVEHTRLLAMREPEAAELIGASQTSVDLSRGSVETPVQLDKLASSKVFTSLKVAGLSADPQLPDRVFLNMENIRGKSDSAVFHVYINLPDGVDPASYPQLLAGTLALFGVRKASKPDGDHGGNGVGQALEITHIIDALHLEGVQDLSQLKVRFIPVSTVVPADQFTIGRVSIYRLGS